MEDKLDVIKQLDENVALAVSANTLSGFAKTFQIAKATEQLQDLITHEFMAPIMKLQGTTLGFLSDRDKDGGYKEDVVKKCVIEAVTLGLEPTGNQFNIIAGNFYVTRNGLRKMLKNIPGLHYELIPKVPRFNDNKTEAIISVSIEWSLNNGPLNKREIEFPIKSNNYMTSEGIIGKGKRKAMGWLYNTICDSDIVDAEAGEYIEELKADNQNMRKNQSSAMNSSVLSSIKDKEKMIKEATIVDEKIEDIQPNKAEFEKKPEEPKTLDWTIPEGGKRELPQMKAIYEKMVENGVTEEEYRKCIIELNSISERFHDLEAFCFSATRADADKVFKKYKELNKIK